MTQSIEETYKALMESARHRQVGKGVGRTKAAARAYGQAVLEQAVRDGAGGLGSGPLRRRIEELGR